MLKGKKKKNETAEPNGKGNGKAGTVTRHCSRTQCALTYKQQGNLYEARVRLCLRRASGSVYFQTIRLEYNIFVILAYYSLYYFPTWRDTFKIITKIFRTALIFKLFFYHNVVSVIYFNIL